MVSHSAGQTPVRDDGEILTVVAGGQSAPVFELAEAAFDDIAAPVAGRVEPDRAATRATAAGTIGLLIAGLGNGVSDPAAA